MLEELKKLDRSCRKEEILFFLQTVISVNQLSKNDIKTICKRTPGNYQLDVESLLIYCACFDLIKTEEGGISVSEDVLAKINSNEQLNIFIVEKTICELFLNQIITVDMFSFDLVYERYLFRNELFPLVFAHVRNILLSQEFFELFRNDTSIEFFVDSRYEKLVASFCKEKKRTITLEQLKKKLEANMQAGEKAEQYILEFEKKRIFKSSLIDKIKIISDIDVCAGYDIVSFDSPASIAYDRFIEVKAVSRSNAFYWPANELSIAKLKGTQYYLYLVDLGRISDESYTPLIVNDPAINIMQSDDWLIEPQSFHIRHI